MLLTRTIFHPNMYARHDLIIQSASSVAGRCKLNLIHACRGVLQSLKLSPNLRKSGDLQASAQALAAVLEVAKKSNANVASALAAVSKRTL